MVKISVLPESRAEVITIADIFRAKIVDVEPESMIIELTGAQSKIDALLKILSEFGILELARTGVTGLSRGAENINHFD